MDQINETVERYQKMKEGMGQELRKFRTSHSYSLRRLADKLEVSAAYLSQIEKGDRQISIKVLQRLVKLMEE
jgi:transcriptional regulator with XRE-family HTH domain